MRVLIIIILISNIFHQKCQGQALDTIRVSKDETGFFKTLGDGGSYILELKDSLADGVYIVSKRKNRKVFGCVKCDYPLIEATYKEGVRNGRYLYNDYFTFKGSCNLSLSIEQNYVNGKLEGDEVVYRMSEDGFVMLISFCQYKNGLKHGQCIDFEGGFVFEIRQYMNGKLISTTEIYRALPTKKLTPIIKNPK